MAAGFIRRYTSDPGLAVITSIEGIVIIDRDPPAQTLGLGSGAVCCVAEFEDGPFNTPTEIDSGLDYLTTFGGFGFTYSGVPSQNPCARARYADGALNPEYWNGNGFIALTQKTFPQLFLVRADTSVGEVSFLKRLFVVGNTDFNWNIDNGQTLAIELDGVTTTATFTSAVAGLVSAAGTYPTTFAGGESITITIDENSDLQIGPTVVVFESGDQTHADVIARINAALGYTAAVATSSTVTTLSGRLAGLQGSVTINAVSSGLVTTATGFAAADTAAGTGNVNDSRQVSFVEVKNIVETAFSNEVLVERDDAGNLRVAAVVNVSRVMYDGSSTATALGFAVPDFDDVVDRFDGTADSVSLIGGGTYPTTFAGGESLTIGFDDDPDFTVVFTNADQSMVQVVARINQAAGATVCEVFDTTPDRIRFFGSKNGGQVRITSASTGVFTILGLAAVTVAAYGAADLSLPAGFRVENAGGDQWVTMQTLAIPMASGTGPFTVKVRPATDDGTAPSAAPTTVSVVVSAPAGLALGCINQLTLSAALSESAIDAAYATALDATLGMTNVAVQTDIIFSARQSNAVRSGLRTNAVTASAQGARGRRDIIRPPLGTTRAQAKAGGIQPGVGAYRNQRNNYAYPGVNITVPQIAAVGTAGGAGFTATGAIDVGFDSWVATTWSQLPPEENPGQQTDFMTPVTSLEKGNADVQNLTMADYIAFKAAGIMAPRVDQGVCVIQSGVTSVLPSQFPQQAPCSRQRFADYISDSLAAACLSYVKKPMTRQRRTDVFAVVDDFLNTLLSPQQPENSRLFAYSVNAKSGNSAIALAAGVFRLIIKVQMNPDMLDIVLDLQVGTTVTVTQLAA